MTLPPVVMLGLVSTLLMSSLLVTTVTSAVIDKRIINGEDAEPLSHPYIASLQFFSKHPNSTNDDDDMNWHHFCGGVLVAKDWVLTAAHCVDWFSHDPSDMARKFRVKMGEHHLDKGSTWEYSLQVSRVVVHPRWCSCAIANDLAMVKLVNHHRFGCDVKTADLSEDDSAYVYKDCVLAGWGRHNRSTWELHKTLQEVNVTYIPNDLCASMARRWFQERNGDDYEGLIEVRGSNICALDTSPHPVEGHGSACHGDSGGPMMCGPDRSVLVGITSWGPPTCESIGVYTRVSKFRRWIKFIMAIDLYWQSMGLKSTPPSRMGDIPGGMRQTPMEKFGQTPMENLGKTPMEKLRAMMEHTPMGKTTMEKSMDTPMEMLDNTPMEKLMNTQIEKLGQKPMELMGTTPSEKLENHQMEKLGSTPMEMIEKSPMEKLKKTLNEMMGKSSMEKLENKPMEKLEKMLMEMKEKTSMEVMGKSPMEKLEETLMELRGKTSIE